MIEAQPPASGSPRAYEYYAMVMAAFVTVLLCANVIGAAKRCQIAGFTFGAVLFFYQLRLRRRADRVCSYAGRKVVWAGFGAGLRLRS